MFFSLNQFFVTLVWIVESPFYQAFGVRVVFVAALSLRGHIL